MARSGQLPTEVEAIFKRLLKLLDDDDEQNKTLPDPPRSSITGGLNCDELPGGQGEFGRSPFNVNRRGKLTPYRRPILTPPSGGSSAAEPGAVERSGTA